MAVAPTGNIFKALSFDNVSSRTYGVYITGEAVYNAPERDVEMISIPGRNGAFALDKGRFENIEVSYPAGIFADNETDFAEAISDFRNFLCSRNGYARLTDEYNPNEYRMAIYKSGLEVSPAQLKAGEFDIVFDCKPQRYLLSGEGPVTIGEWGETETASSDIVSVENPNGVLAVKSLEVDLEPIQSGSETPSPTNVRPISGHTSVDVIVSPTTTASDGTTYTTALGRTVYGGTLDVVSGELTVDRAMVTLNGSETWTASNGTATACMRVQTRMDTGFKPNASNTSLVGDISSAFVEVTPNQTWDGTIGFSVSTDATNPYLHFCQTGQKNMSVDTWKTYLASNPIQVVGLLATPQTYQLTAQQIELITGTNNIWSDGEVTVEFGEDPNQIFNPTLFGSSPMLEVTGHGEISLNGEVMAVNNEPLGQTKLSKLGNANKVTLDVSNLNTGDSIYKLEADKPQFEYGLSPKSGSFGTFEITSVSYCTAYISGTPTKQKLIIVPNFPQIVKGTNTTVSASVGLTITLNGTTYNGSVSVALQYSGSANTIGMIISRSGMPTTTDVSYSPYYQHPAYYGDSTKLIAPTPMYLDLDIGEAYGIVNGEVVFFNNIVSLPAELPKLKAGNNTITFDNTVTDLKVVPRWWKI